MDILEIEYLSFTYVKNLPSFSRRNAVAFYQSDHYFANVPDGLTPTPTSFNLADKDMKHINLLGLIM